MKIVSAAEMRLIDQRTIKDYRIPGMVLMERAGLAVANRIRHLTERKKVVVLSGGGNNGGDGIAAARNLHAWGWNVRVLLTQREDRLSPDCRAQYRIAKKSGVPVLFRSSINEKDLHSSIVVDALLGTGINKPVAPPVSDIIAFVNRSAVMVVSVDVPSGISSDDGRIMGEAMQADITVTFGLPKIGHMLHPGADFTGKLFVEDIGFPDELLKSRDIRTESIERSDAISLIPERPSYSHKGDYGHILVLAGSRGKTGAAMLTARSCLKAGAGMVTLGVPETLADIFQSRVTEEMVLPLPDSGRGTFSEEAFEGITCFLNEKADILAAGPGITNEPGVVRLIRKLLVSVTAPMVIDADGINALSGEKKLFRKVKAPVILTPHVGEMVRLLASQTSTNRRSPGVPLPAPPGRFRDEVENNRIDTARSFSSETGAYLVLKGAPTVVAEPLGEVFVNTTGNPGMATAGSGDVLTGITASFLGQGLTPLAAAILGVYIHGLSADRAVLQKGMHSLVASDIIESLPDAFLSLQDNA